MRDTFQSFPPEYIRGCESSRDKCHRNNDNTVVEGMLLRTLFTVKCAESIQKWCRLIIYKTEIDSQT